MGVTFWIVAPVTALLLISTLSSATLTDIYCLKTIKKSVQDPNGYLDGWDSANSTEGVICKMTGVECWHPDENKVLNLRLSGFGLRGPFPSGLENCSSLTGLDLSNNNFSGPIPADVSRRLVFVTNLDLSSNHFSGEIPVGLANCSYLNILKLDDNDLTGTIPAQLGQLGRISTFSVSGNQLSGPVPVFSNGTQITAESYAGNPGLCGKLLKACVGPPEKSRTGVIAASAAGSVVVVAVVVAVGLYYLTPAVLRKKRKDDDPEGNKWAKSIKGTKGIKLSTFEKSLSKMRFSDLMKATNSFHKDNAIGGGRTGTMYKATLVDGQTLIVKRLQDSRHLEKEFASEMGTLGTLRHTNLVPLLGYCVADKERLVVYRYMENGTLHDRIHDPASASQMDWPTRLRVAIGAAKGLAWLHHNCNPRIIHRNISSKCVLLDENFDAKLCDFGLARLMNPIDTHLSTFVNGEFGDLGYVAPEYPQKLVATPKGDVYSFGVVLLELATGESPTRVTRASAEGFKGSLVEWVSDLSAASNLRTALDPALLRENEPGRDNELTQFIRVACRCVLVNPKERPTMFEVYQLLRAIGERYHFTADEDVLVPTQTDDVSFPDDLIVAR